MTADLKEAVRFLRAHVDTLAAATGTLQDRAIESEQEIGALRQRVKHLRDENAELKRGLPTHPMACGLFTVRFVDGNGREQTSDSFTTCQEAIALAFAQSATRTNVDVINGRGEMLMRFTMHAHPMRPVNEENADLRLKIVLMTKEIAVLRARSVAA